MKNFLISKLFFHLFVIFAIQKIKPLYAFKPLLLEIMNSEIFFTQNTPQSAFFGFPDNKENFEIISHLHLLFKYYLFKVRDKGETSLEEWKENN